MELRGPFDGFVEKPVCATSTCLIMADHNRYSVDARAAGRMVLMRSHDGQQRKASRRAMHAREGCPGGRATESSEAQQAAHGAVGRGSKLCATGHAAARRSLPR